MTDLRERADARLRTAYELVRELDLLGRWSRYGDVEGGSPTSTRGTGMSG